MKLLKLISLFALLLMASPVLSQGEYGAGHTCWQCPVCGTVFQLTPNELALAAANPYRLCPACGSAYLGYFVQVPCQALQVYGQQEENRKEVDQPGPDNVADVGLAGKEDSAASFQGAPLLVLPRFNQSAESKQVNNNTEGNLTGVHGAVTGKILMVLPFQDFQEDEMKVPREHFREQGYEVVLASKGGSSATDMSGEKVNVDLDMKEVDVKDYSAVVFVGGDGIELLKLYDDPDYLSLAKASADGRVVSAICLGSNILANAGLLQGKQATGADTEYLCGKGAVISYEPVVQDGNTITASGPDAALHFAETIVQALRNR
jgi:protease I